MNKYIIFIALLLFSCTAFSQVDLSVTVINSSSAKPVEDVMLLLENKEIGLKQTLQPSSAGKAIFKSLSTAGTYTITLISNKYFSEPVDNIQLRANELPSVQIVASEKKVGELKEIKVFSGSSKINTINAEVSAQLKRKELETLPIEGRDITRSLYRLPNVTQATGFYPEAPNVSINGANSLFSSYLIDGMDNNERFLGGQKFAIPLGFTQNVTVLTNNYSAEFGNSSNGLFNIATASGSYIE